MEQTTTDLIFFIIAILSMIVLPIGYGAMFKIIHKTSRLDNKTDDFIQLKHWDSRKDGMK